MKVPKIFVPEKDLKDEVKKLLKEPVKYSTCFNDEVMARKVRDEIENRIGFEDGLAKREATLNTYADDSDDSALVAILDCLLSNEAGARRIRDAIEEKIGFNGIFVRRGIGNNLNASVFSNVSYATLDYLLGNSEIARRMRDELQRQFNGGFIKNASHGNWYTLDNTSFAILDWLLDNEKRARDIRDEIVTKIGFDGSLIKNGVGENIYADSLYTYNSALYGILCLAERLKNYKKLYKPRY